MKVDWYTTSSLKKWQAIAKTLESSVSIHWKSLGREDCNQANSTVQSRQEPEAEICVVSDVESQSAEALASLNLNARVRVAILGAVDLSELLFARDLGSIETPRNTPPLINRLRDLLAGFDGVITVSEDQAEVVRHHLLMPAKVIRIPHLLDSDAEARHLMLGLTKQDFADRFLEFLQEVHQWLPLMRLCDRVGEEMAYLGVDEEMPVIEVVSKHVSALLPGV